jgi:hypothetical protein
MSEYTVTSVKTYAVSDDGKKVKITLATKHVGDLVLAMSQQCADDLVEALGAKPLQKGKPAQGGREMRATIPKKWMVTTDLKVPGIVLLLFDPKTESQTGFGLQAKAAKAMGVGLVKRADAVLARKRARRH